MDNKIIITDRLAIHRKLQRMAYEVWEHNSDEQEITIVGIEGGGMTLARGLAARLKAISTLNIQVAPLQINKRHPLSQEILLEGDFAGKNILLVDDVANSGKTLLYAMKPMLAFEPKKIMIAVLVDRKHKSFPVSPDIIGLSIATTLQEHIEVICEGDEITAVQLL